MVGWMDGWMIKWMDDEMDRRIVNRWWTDDGMDG